jgi:4-hydroxybenzoate polyprenyltransferase
LLDGAVVAVIAVVAGAQPLVALRLGLAMTALQASIGSLNDVVDAPRDAGHKPGKPIPAGLVSGALARAVVAVMAVVGLGLSLASGPSTVALAVVVLGIGYGYDLSFKGTAWSWLPFAVGIPILPVYAWLGSTGTLPPSFAVLVPTAVVAGSALAIANARADLERDAAAGVDSVAVRLGLGRSWAVAAALLAIVIAAALVTLVRAEASTAAIAAAGGASVVVAAGVILGRRGDSARRERAWQLQAVGVGLLAAAWLAGIELANGQGGLAGG